MRDGVPEMKLGGSCRPGFTSTCLLYYAYSFFFSSVVLELELLLGVLLAPELGVVLEPAVLLDWSLEDEEAPLLGVVLGDALDDEDELLGGVLGEVEEELEPELGVLGTVALPDAEPLAEPGERLVASLEDDPDEDVEPDGEDGVVAPRVLSPGPGPRSQP